MARVPAQCNSRNRNAQPPEKQQLTAPTSRGRTILAGAALVTMVLASYAYALRCDFIWDDDDYVTKNATLESLDGLRRIWFELGAVPQYYPLVHTTFWIERHLWGLDPSGYHAVNIAAARRGVLLVWRLLAAIEGARSVAGRRAVRRASGRSRIRGLDHRAQERLVACRWRLPFVAAPICGSRRSTGQTCRRRRTVLHGSARAVVLVCRSLALLRSPRHLSKTVVVTLPAVLLVIVWWKRGRITLAMSCHWCHFSRSGISLGLVTVWMEKHFVGAAGEEWSLTPVERVLLAGRVLWFYAAKLVWPYPLAFFYPRFADRRPCVVAVSVSAGGDAVSVGALWRARRRIGRGPLAAVLIFAGVLTPALGFFDVYPFRFSFVADHFQYHASIALLALAAAGLAALLDCDRQRDAARGLSARPLLLFVARRADLLPDVRLLRPGNAVRRHDRQESDQLDSVCESVDALHHSRPQAGGVRLGRTGRRACARRFADQRQPGGAVAGRCDSWRQCDDKLGQGHARLFRSRWRWTRRTSLAQGARLRPDEVRPIRRR